MNKRRLAGFACNDRLQQKSARTVKSYRLVLKWQHWYFEGFYRTREGFRIFKLSRVAETVLLPERYKPHAFMSKQVIKPIFADRDIVLATLRVRKAALEQLLDLCGPECLRPASGGDVWIATLPVSDNPRSYRFFTWFRPGL